jgi:hypothetical protein
MSNQTDCLNKFRIKYDADISSVCPLGKINLIAHFISFDDVIKPENDS